MSVPRNAAPALTMPDPQDSDPERSIVRRFEEVAALHGACPAIISDGVQLTYSEVNSAANRWARELIARGGAPGDRVAVLMQHSAPLILATLAALKAGRTVVVLNMSDPAARLQHVLENATPGLLLTDTVNLDRSRQVAADALDVLCRDGLQGHEVTPNSSLAIPPDQLAFLIYTSGTTGQPKGVMRTHRNIVHQASRYQGVMELQAGDRVALFASLSTGQGLSTTWSALLNGAAVCPYQIRELGIAGLAQWVQRQRITAFVSTTSIFRYFTSTLDRRQRFADVRLVRLGAEPATSQDFVAYQRYFPDHCVLLHTYSSSETGNITQLRLAKTDKVAEGRLPVGRPAAGVEVRIVDADGRELPRGETGEIAISSRHLSPGYWRDDTLTEEKFVGPVGGSNPRIFRSGDLGCLASDGQLIHLGRKDDLIKINGYRVELGEIERTLTSHPGVHQSAVVLRNDRAEEHQLAAYYAVAAAHSTAVSPGELLSYLQERLPAYMLPSTLVRLDAFPLTPIGKVDHRALLAAGSESDEGQLSYVAPRNGIEEALAAVWAGVLGQERVGVHQNFFALGGHSLKAAQAVARASDLFEVEVPMRLLFEAPTVAEMAARISGLRAGGAKPRAALRISIDQPANGPLPPSFAQQRLWFLEQLEGGLTAYNMPSAVRLLGDLDADALKRALESIVARHEPLRTTLKVQDGVPWQWVHAAGPFEIPCEDLRGVAPDARTTTVAECARDEAERPFELSRDPMLRARLLRLADQEHVLLVTMHHIASDAWSRTILWRELRLLYNAYRSNQVSPLPPLPARYADYAVWQREQLQGERLERLVSHWRDRLKGLAPLELPTDRPRPASQSYRGARREFDLPGELVRPLRDLCRASGATLHMGLLAAFQALLARYSGRDDVAVGVPTEGRAHPALEPLIGFCVNTLVVRTDLSDSPSFRNLLARVRRVSLEAYDHAELPFERLVEELRPERHLDRSPLVQVIFQLIEFDPFEFHLEGLEVSWLPLARDRVHFDLEMFLRPAGDGICATLAYSTDLYEQSTIERLIGHYRRLLEGIVADPERNVSDLPLLSERERHQLLTEWNDTAVEYPYDKCVHELFEEQVQLTPDAVAVVFKGQQLTYRELNERANQLAHHLRELGIGPESLVGLCLERSLDLVVGILGILKADGAYVPLDAEYPVERLAFMLQDARVEYLVTQHHLLKQLPQADYHAICLDTDAATLETRARANPHSSVQAHNVAYVMYTSGSTGAPKGVMIPHRALVNALWSFARQPGLSADDVLLAITTVSFDIAGLELFLPLVVGARVELAGGEASRNPEALAALLTERPISVLQATPATWRMLLDFGWRPRPDLKLLCGGETLDAELAGQLLSGGGELWNLYGPTETTIWSTVERIVSAAGPILIGRPIANTEVFVLDDERRPTPIGVPGELYIGGAGVARGYLAREDLTAARFVSHPFSDREGAKLYRTGDLARWRADGKLECLGRTDQQVKIRGFRVELGEIEAALVAQGEIREAAVVLREDRPGDQRLVAYVVAADGVQPEAHALRDHLARTLPAYMIPAAVVPLRALPLTPNRKIDRRALPAPDSERFELAHAYTGPRDQIERTLAEVWAEVLAVERVGIDDSFFELGGHSLLAVKLFARVEERFVQRLALATLFRAPTIRCQAELLRKQGLGRRSIVEIQPHGARPRLYLVPSFTGDLLHYRALVAHLGADQPIYGFEPRGENGQKRACTRIEELAATLVEELATFQPEGPYCFAGYSFGGIVAYEMAQQLTAAGREVALVGIIDAAARLHGPARAVGSATALRRILGNLPHWLRDDLWESGPREVAARVRRKARAAVARLGWSRGPQVSVARGALDEFVDIDHLSDHYRWLIETNYDAFLHYYPAPYTGRITLLRSRTRPLWHTRPRDLNWGGLAREGVDLEIIPGNHASILTEPRVRTLGERLRDALDRVACSPPAVVALR